MSEETFNSGSVPGTEVRTDRAPIKEKPLEYKIVELDRAHLEKASTLADEVFAVVDGTRPSENFAASLDPESEEARAMAEKDGVTSAKYYLAVDAEDNVIGTMGLYTMEDDSEEAYWLGWYCVDPNVRGQGVGLRLLNQAIDMSRSAEKKFLRLYTSTHSSEAKAQEVYVRNGFVTTHMGEDELVDEDGERYNLLYREKKLTPEESN